MNKYDIRDITFAESGHRKIEWVRNNMPLLRAMEEEFKRDRPLDGIKISLSVHLEAKTAYLCLVLAAGGAHMSVTGSNSLSTQDDVAAALADRGLKVFAYHGATDEEYMRHLEMCLEHKPNIIIDMTNVQAMAVKVAMILIFTVINLMGLKEVSVVNTVFSVMIIAVFALVTVVGFANWEFNPVEPFTPEGESVVSSLGGSVCIAIWMYCGYECVAYVSGEIENPKVIPKGFFIAMPLIALSYILPTVAGLGSIGSWESWSTESAEGTVGYADVLTQNLGQAWGVVFIIIAIISQCAIFNTYITAGSRGFLVMSDDNLSPKFLGKVDKKRGMPYWGIILIAAVTMIMSTFDFSTIIILVGPVCIVVYFTISVSLIVLRKKYPVDKRGDIYYIKGGKKVIYVITALVFIVGIAGIIVNGTEYFIMSFITIGSGLVAYIIFKLLYGGLYRKSPDRYPINEKTRLATGDVMRIGLFMLLCGILAFFGALFITWYEGAYGEEYYLETYGKGILSDFWLMIKILKFGGIISGILGIILLILGKRYDDTERIKKESL